jgi:glyoxylase-like metal-dependent hydrolase (beta-lactamase superfamily II)
VYGTGEKVNDGYTLDVLVRGFPGTTRTHGGLGWCSVSVLRDGTRTVVVDAGPPAYQETVLRELEQRGISTSDVTDVLTTHLHWDHIGNFTMFPNAVFTVGRVELEWSAQQPPETPLVADLHVRRLLELGDRVRTVDDGDEVVPGITAIAVPGHTPGHMCFRASVAGGDVLFAGDSVKNRYELATGDVHSSLDFEASRASVERLRALMEQDPSIVMVPGHDVPLAWVNGEVTATEPLNAELSVYLDTHDDPDSQTFM